MIFLVSMVAVLALSFAGAAMAARVACDGGTCRGTNRIDTMTGSTRVDRMYGFGGNDRMNGSYNNDVMVGGSGSDNMNGSFGFDTLFGNEFADTLSGGLADDKIYAGPGTDTAFGGAGNDHINIAGDASSDSVDCGTGQDTVVVDAREATPATLAEFVRRTDCETVKMR